MTNPALGLAKWKKGGPRVALAFTNTATPASLTHILREIGVGGWSQPNLELSEWDINLSGVMMRHGDTIVLNASRPTFTLDVPMTKLSLFLGLSSLLQQDTYQGTPNFRHLFGIPTSPVIDGAGGKWLHIETGIDGSNANFEGVKQAKGCHVNSATFNVPPSGADGGRPSLSLSVIGSSGTANPNFITGGAADAFPLLYSRDHYLKVNTVARKMTQMTATISMGTEMSPNISTGVPDGMVMSELKIEGSVSVIMTDAALEYDILYTAYTGKTVVILEWGVTTSYKVAIDALIQEPTFSEQGNLLVAQFPFRSIYVTAASFAAEVNNATSIGAYPTS